MSHGIVHYLYHLDPWGYFFIPGQGNRVQGNLTLVRNCYHTLRLQSVKTIDFTLASDLSAPTAAHPDWPSFTGSTFGLKTAAQFEDSGDFTAAWSGFDTNDTAWHSPANKRYSFAIAPTHATAVGLYPVVWSLTDGSVTVKLPDFPMLVNLVQEGVIGTEATAPSGISSNSGTATILNGTDSIAVAFVGMTAAGHVIPFWVGAAQSTLGVTAGTGTFTIQAGGPVSGNSVVGYFVVKTS